MTALFDIRTILKIITFPFRLVRGDGGDFEPRQSRNAISQRWRRGDDGKLEGRWNS